MGNKKKDKFEKLRLSTAPEKTSAASGSADNESRMAEQREHGIMFDDDYDYLQHFAPGHSDGLSVFISADYELNGGDFDCFNDDMLLDADDCTQERYVEDEDNNATEIFGFPMPVLAVGQLPSHHLEIENMGRVTQSADEVSSPKNARAGENNMERPLKILDGQTNVGCVNLECGRSFTEPLEDNLCDDEEFERMMDEYEHGIQATLGQAGPPEHLHADREESCGHDYVEVNHSPHDVSVCVGLNSLSAEEKSWILDGWRRHSPAFSCESDGEFEEETRPRIRVTQRANFIPAIDHANRRTDVGSVRQVDSLSEYNPTIIAPTVLKSGSRVNVKAGGTSAGPRGPPSDGGLSMSMTDAKSMYSLMSQRNKSEAKEEKHERKKTLKVYRSKRREAKADNRRLFNRERIRQMESRANKSVKSVTYV